MAVPTMVDCRGLIEFCRAFEQHQNTVNSQASSDQRTSSKISRSKKNNSFNSSSSDPFCEHSPFAALDIVMMLLVLVALGVLVVPYLNFILQESIDLLPMILDILGRVICNPTVAFAVGFVLMIFIGIVLWKLIGHHFRKCGNPCCKGLGKSVEFDIQLEPEECVMNMPLIPMDEFGSGPLDLGRDHKELEAELKKMAPLNGRTVLIFRNRCGCPVGWMEVWGAKKVRRIKK